MPSLDPKVGIVKFFSNTKGFGFISPVEPSLVANKTTFADLAEVAKEAGKSTEDNPEVFVHFSSILMPEKESGEVEGGKEEEEKGPYRTLVAGDIVDFQQYHDEEKNKIAAKDVVPRNIITREMKYAVKKERNGPNRQRRNRNRGPKKDDKEDESKEEGEDSPGEEKPKKKRIRDRRPRKPKTDGQDKEKGEHSSSTAETDGEETAVTKPKNRKGRGKKGRAKKSSNAEKKETDGEGEKKEDGEKKEGGEKKPRNRNRNRGGKGKKENAEEKSAEEAKEQMRQCGIIGIGIDSWEKD